MLVMELRRLDFTSLLILELHPLLILKYLRFILVLLEGLTLMDFISFRVLMDAYRLGNRQAFNVGALDTLIMCLFK